MPRETRHVEPRGLVPVARHYVRELVYGSNDGIITTFAVVAGVAGGGLPLTVVLVCGVANLFADGLSMAVGSYLAIRANESVLEVQGLPEEEASAARHGIATFVAFTLAGALPLVPYAVPLLPGGRFVWSTLLTLSALFLVGAVRVMLGSVRWWSGGLEMLGLGAIVAAVAYWSGALVAAVVGGAVPPGA